MGVRRRDEPPSRRIGYAQIGQPQVQGIIDTFVETFPCQGQSLKRQTHGCTIVVDCRPDPVRNGAQIDRALGQADNATTAATVSPNTSTRCTALEVCMTAHPVDLTTAWLRDR